MNVRPDRWLYGLPALALLWVVAMLDATPRIERELRRDLAQPTAPSPPGNPVRPRPEVDGRDVVVVTEPGVDRVALAEAESAARLVEGVRRVRIEEAANVPMNPFRMTFTRGPDGIALAGGVPSPALRSILAAEAAALAGTDPVDDRLRPASGEPADLAEAARFLLAALAHVGTGEASLVDRTLSFKGEAASPAAYEAAQAVLAAPPAGFTIPDIDLIPPKLDPYRWDAVRTHDALVFGGAVPSSTLRAALLGQARSRFPGLTLRDEMQTFRGLDPSIDFSGLTETGLSALAKLTAGRVELAGRRVTVTGEGAAKDLLTGLESELRRTLPAAVELAPVSIRSIPASPYTFSARRDGGRIVLSGYVSDEAERRSFRDLAAARFVGDSVVDELRLADGAPALFSEAVRLGLTSLSELAEGRAILTDAAIALDGRSLYPQWAERLRQALPKAAPGGWTATASIRSERIERPLEASLCADLLADALRRDPITFDPGATAPAPAAKAGLDAVAALVARCGAARIKVVHHLAAARPDASDLAKRRADAIASALIAARPAAQLSTEGIAHPAGTRPAPGASLSETARTEFMVTP